MCIFNRLVISLASFGLFFAPIAAFADLSPAMDKAALQLLSTNPEQQDFQKPLLPLVKFVRTIKSANGEADKTASLETTRQAAAQLLTELHRGYHDEIYYLLGLAFDHAGDLSSAIANYEHSLALRGDNQHVLFRNAYATLRNGQCDKAIPMLRESAWRDDKQSNQVFYLIGECLLTAERKEEALVAFQESAKHPPVFIPTFRRLLLLQTEAYELAQIPSEKALIESSIQSILEVLVKNDPGDLDSTTRYAKFLLKYADPLANGNNLQRAEKLLQEATKTSKYKHADSVRLYADILIKKKDMAEASRIIDLGLAATPESQLLQEAKSQLLIEQQLLEKKNLQTTGATISEPTTPF